MPAISNKTKYHGTFNVSGEVTKFYVHAVTRCDAMMLFGRKLSKKYGRKIFVDRIDHQIEECAG